MHVKRTTLIKLQILLCSIVGLLIVLIGNELFFRFTLPYSETGKYFDEAQGVSYEEQGIIVYTLAFALCLLVLVVLCYWTLKSILALRKR